MHGLSSSLNSPALVLRKIIPADSSGTPIPEELLALVFPFVFNDLQTLVAWSGVCKAFLQGCLQSCASYRTLHFLSQLRAFEISYIETTPVRKMVRFVQMQREEDGTALFRPHNRNYAYSLLVQNLSWKALSYHLSLTELDEFKGHVDYSSIQGCFLIEQGIVVLTFRGIALFTKTAPGEYKFDKSILLFESLGEECICQSCMLNQILLVSIKVKGEDSYYWKKINLGLGETKFSPISFPGNDPYTLISTQEGVYLTKHSDSMELYELTFNEEGLCIANYPIPLSKSLHYKVVSYKHWLVYCSSDQHLQVVNLKNGKSIQDLELLKGRFEDGEMLIMRDDFLFIYYKNATMLLMHLPTRQDFTNEISPLLMPILEERALWPVDFSVEYDNDMPFLRFLMAEKERDEDYATHKTERLDITLRKNPIPREKKIVFLEPTSSCGLTAKKTLVTAALVFFCLGVGGFILFETLHVAPILTVGKEALLSLPAILTFSIGISGFLLTALIASVSRANSKLV